MEGASEKSYTSPQRKLVKFFERSRDRWKAKSREAKTALKRLGTQLRRSQRRNAEYQQQLVALQPQVAEWQAKQAQAAAELEAVKKTITRFKGGVRLRTVLRVFVITPCVSLWIARRASLFVAGGFLFGSPEPRRLDKAGVPLR